MESHNRCSENYMKIKCGCCRAYCDAAVRACDSLATASPMNVDQDCAPNMAPSTRYDFNDEHCDSSADMFFTDYEYETSARTLGQSAHDSPPLLAAAETLVKHLSENEEDLFDAHDVSAFLNLPLTAAHGLLDVLDVVEVHSHATVVMLRGNTQGACDILMVKRRSELHCVHGCVCAGHPSAWGTVSMAWNSALAYIAAEYKPQVPRYVSIPIGILNAVHCKVARSAGLADQVSHVESFAAGVSMQTGVAVPKVCRAMIAHLQNNEVRLSCHKIAVGCGDDVDAHASNGVRGTCHAMHPLHTNPST
jgi:hypothetical protein